MERAIETNPQQPEERVRVEPAQELAERYHNAFTPQELTALASSLFGELRDMYHINVPATFFVGKDATDAETVCSRVAEVHGASLEGHTFTEAESVHVEELYTNIARYLRDKLYTGGFYLSDINAATQYVWGTTATNKEPALYLIDTDVYVNNDTSGLYLVAEWCTRHMSSVERHIGRPFTQARAYIQGFVNKDPSSVLPKAWPQFEESRTRIQQLLNGEKTRGGPDIGIPPFVV